MSTTPHKNFVAGADLRANKDRFVKFDGSGDLVVCGAGEDMVGIQLNEADTGLAIAVSASAITTKLKIGATVAIDDKLKSDGTGRGIATAGAGELYGAKALQAGVVNDIINVETVVTTAIHA